MDKIVEIRGLIYEAFHRWKDSTRHFHGNNFERYCISMDLIDDTGSAVWSHMREGFSADPMRAYIEFWGVMQAIVIQQDAIDQLYEAVLDDRPMLSPGSAWKRLRKYRNLCAGHPANHGVGKADIYGTKLRRL